jgi:hypothetical protein
MRRSQPSPRPGHDSSASQLGLIAHPNIIKGENKSTVLMNVEGFGGLNLSNRN